MNKEKFLEEVKKVTGFDDEKVVKVNDILEESSLVGKKNKENVVSRFENELGMTNEEADDLYNKLMSIVAAGIKNKLKHPFGKQ